MEPYYDKLISLLEKEELNEEDKLFLNELSAKNPEAKSFIEAHDKLKDIVKSSSHISVDELADYILTKNNFNKDQTISLKKYWPIDKHLKDCKSCSAMYHELSNEFMESGSIIGKYFVESNSSKESISKFPKFLYKNNFIKYPLVSALSLVVLFFVLELISNFTVPQNYRLGQIHNQPLSSITRGRASLEFQEGLTALDNGNYNKAILFFEKDINNYGSQNSTFYTYYILGLTYLESAEKDFLGLFISYDTGKINKAVENFNKCILENNSGNYPDVSFNSYYFMAKAELILNNKALAIKYLKLVVENKGGRMNEANELLRKIE